MCSKAQVYECLLDAFARVGGVPHVFAYDDGCHLSKYMLNPIRFEAQNVTLLQRLFAYTLIVVDPFHFPGHVDQQCKLYHDPSKFKELKNVNMEVSDVPGAQRMTRCPAIGHSSRKARDARRLSCAQRASAGCVRTDL